LCAFFADFGDEFFNPVDLIRFQTQFFLDGLVSDDKDWGHTLPHAKTCRASMASLCAGIRSIRHRDQRSDQHATNQTFSEHPDLLKRCFEKAP
jgi:hypothetical protein